MATLFVKPAEGRRVRRPTVPFSPIPEHGAEVTDSSFWQRRIAAGDLELTTKEDVEAGNELANEKAAAEAAGAPAQ